MDAVASSPAASVRADASRGRDALLSSSSAPPSGANDGQRVASLSVRDEACETHNAIVGPQPSGTIPNAHGLRGRRSIFVDDEEEADEEEIIEVFSVDATVAPVETTMQPKRIESRVGRPPLRARRVLDLMDRLDASDHHNQSTEPSSPSTEGICAQKKRPLSVPMSGEQCSGTVAVDADEEEQEGLVIPRPWKRRTAGEAAANISTLTGTSEAMLPPPLPRVRPSLGRSFSSHSVFLDRPKLSFKQTTGDAGGQTNGSTPQPRKLALPTIRSSSHPDLNVISPHTVASLIKGEYSDRLDGFTLIDCRFQYEFEGGSLLHALSMNNPAQVEDHFLQRPPKNSTRTALIFYCEFSANRAPKMLRHLRNLDRWIHAERYPELFYPELYLIDGGYKNCFMTLKEVICCQPALYRPMNDKAFIEHCKRDFAIHRANWRQHKSTSCASKFQQLHRRIHDSLETNSDTEDNLCGPAGGDDDLLTRPTTLRSFSQQS